MFEIVHKLKQCPCPAWCAIGLVAASWLFVNDSTAAPVFPKLTGRVVDSAEMLDSAAEQRIGELLKGHESATTNQVVVVTLPDLGGYDIESYGYQLGRHWGIGQKNKDKDNDNGVLLIVAKKERKVRIEVGYGLEGTLTDALSANIINSVIVPSFKKGRFAAGIEAGATAVIQALGGEYKIKKKSKSSEDSLFKFIFILFFIFWGFIGNMGWGRRNRRGGGYYGGGYGGGGFGGGGGGGGGFSGGGGGFGGGGASGGW